MQVCGSKRIGSNIDCQEVNPRVKKRTSKESPGAQKGLVSTIICKVLVDCGEIFDFEKIDWTLYIFFYYEYTPH